MIREQRMRVETPVVLALGSNLGDREATIRSAVTALSRIQGLVLTRASSLYETPAVKPDGVDESAPAYLNAVVAGRTTLAPEDLLTAIATVERGHGRTRAERWGDRTLDIDIIAMGALSYATETLQVPHPRAVERGFVLEPWAEIDPQASLPGVGAIGPLLSATTDRVTRLDTAPLLEASR